MVPGTGKQRNPRAIRVTHVRRDLGTEVSGLVVSLVELAGATGRGPGQVPTQGRGACGWSCQIRARTPGLGGRQPAERGLICAVQKGCGDECRGQVAPQNRPFKAATRLSEPVAGRLLGGLILDPFPDCFTRILHDG